MDGQMSIFDFLPQQAEHPDFHNMTEAEMVSYVGKVLGVTFQYNNHLEYWECFVSKKRKFKLELCFSHYCHNWKKDEANGELFISVGYNYTHGGGGSPCDSFEEAIDYFKRTLERQRNGFYEPAPSQMEDDE